MTLIVKIDRNYKIKINYSDSHNTETYFSQEKHRLRSSKNKCKIHQLPSPNDVVLFLRLKTLFVLNKLLNIKMILFFLQITKYNKITLVTNIAF